MSKTIEEVKEEIKELKERGFTTFEALRYIKSKREKEKTSVIQNENQKEILIKNLKGLIGKRIRISFKDNYGTCIYESKLIDISKFNPESFILKMGSYGNVRIPIKEYQIEEINNMEV